MPEDASLVEPQGFVVNNLVHFPHFFSDEELEALKRCGQHATDLTDGSVEPISEKEHYFVEMARGLRPPETRFQRVWLRYRQATVIESRLNAKVLELTAAKRSIRALHEEERRKLSDTSIVTWEKDYLPPESLGDEVRRLKIWGRSAWNQLEQLRTDSATKIKELESQIRELKKQIAPVEGASAQPTRDRGNKGDFADTWDGGGNEWREQK